MSEDNERYEHIIAEISSGELNCRYQLEGGHIENSMTHDEEITDDWTEEQVIDLIKDILSVPEGNEGCITVYWD